ncbi:uncharacterized protein LOC117169303 [Belonocnema kinseyi]|uniref:uncharacterized protein LOC117169303 n=1 Tax=Belonocnema kinseyi TaxID=2817044 RepID=UPI00143CC819|nr:uncharacterized protein LOC117169303 [Belonocnema kinseyi]
MRFYVGVNINGILRPMFDYQGNMVIVRLRDHEVMPMPPGIAKQYRFTLPPWQVELLEAFRLARKQNADAHLANSIRQHPILPHTDSTSSYKQRQKAQEERYYHSVRQTQAGSQFYTVGPVRQPVKDNSQSFTSAKQSPIRATY